MRRPFRLLRLLVLGSTACATTGGQIPPQDSTAAAPVPSPSESSLAASETPATCADVSTEALEPSSTSALDLTPIPLASVYVRRETKPEAGPIERIDLGSFPVSAWRGDPAGRLGWGMGWEGVHAGWFDGNFPAQIRTPFEAWAETVEPVGDLSRRQYLLTRRADFFANAPDLDAGAGPDETCTRQLLDETTQALADAHERTRKARQTLESALEGLPADARTPQTRLLACGLLEADIPYPHHEHPTLVEPVRAVCRSVVEDDAAPPKARARAADVLARMGTGPDGSLRKWLAVALQHAQDPGFRLELMIKLADSEPDEDARRRRNEAIVALLTDPPEGLQWRAAERWSALAEAQLERGDFRATLDAALACANAQSADFPDEPDPWGCAIPLAEALAEGAPFPEGTTIPRAFLGPLAPALMRAAEDRFDRDQAVHVGEVLLSDLPMAPSAPQVATMLQRSTPDPARANALATALQETYAVDGPWHRAQVERLAWKHAPAQFDGVLARLVVPAIDPVAPLPVTGDERRQQLRERARVAADLCRPAMKAGQRFSVVVDATGPLPVATVKGKSGARACLERTTEARFRSLGRVRATFVVMAQ